MGWKPATMDEVKGILEGELKACNSEQTAIFRKLAHHPILYFPALLAVTPLMPTGLVTNIQTPVISDEIGLPVLRAS